MTSALMSTYPPQTVTFVRGEGSRLWDDTGKAYLDLLSGLAVTSLGHAHPEVADAIAEQARTLLHVSNLYGTEPGPQVAAALDRLLGGGGKGFFCNSGAEANEAAIKLSRKFGVRGRHVVVSAYGSFHGRMLATVHATGQPEKHEAFQPLPEGFRHVACYDLDALESALTKLSTAAGDAASAAAAVTVDLSPGVSETTLGTLRDPVRRRRRVHLRYLVPSRDETTERDVDPIRVMTLDGRWYLDGWCHRAESARRFRLDRVVSVDLLDADGTPPAGVVPPDLDDVLTLAR